VLQSEAGLLCIMRFLFLILIVLPCSVNAQRIDSVRQSDGFRFVDGVFYTYTSPLRWKGKDWAKLGGVLAGTAVLTLVDRPIRDFWGNQNSEFLDGVNTVGYHYGKPYSAFIFSGGFYLGGMLFKSEWAKETGLILGTSLLSAGLLEMTLKPSIGRARPSEGKGNYDLTFFNREAAYHSFPSGHASMAFTISMVMARRVKSVPVKILFYSLAASTVTCRLYSDAHWISDIAFGGTIAWFCSDIALKRLTENKFRAVNTKRFQWKVYPYPSGMTVRATF
jgi:membrane-associated phospholipid phosphatase